jgi:protein O-GlcNAc transferase
MEWPLGVLRKLAGDVVGAIDAYEQCLRVNPNHALGRGNISIALSEHATAVKASGDVHLAIRGYERALTFDPNAAEATYNLGVAQAEVGEIDRAIIAYEHTLRLKPNCAEAWNNLGVLHRERNNVERAVECYNRAIAIAPAFAQPLNNVGVVYTTQGNAGAALEALQRAIAADPSYAVAHNNLGVLLRDTGDVPEALASYAECERCSPDHRNATQNYLLSLNYVHPGESAVVSDAHARWGARFQKIAGEALPRRRFARSDLGAGRERVGGALRRRRENSDARGARFIGLTRRDADSDSDADADSDSDADYSDDVDDADDAEARDALLSGRALSPRRRLVVGYVSSDLYTHSVSYFAFAPFRDHDPSRVELFVYSTTPREDAQSTRLRDAVAAARGTWRDCAAMSESELAETIRGDRVDVLVELTGHTANNKLGTMALRPAPVQATWIGYPNSTGLTSIDYRLTDAICDPLDTTQSFVEKLVRLPGCFLSYTPSAEAPPVAPAPCMTAGFVTFGCFNALAKVTPRVRKVWGRLLAAVPNSRLVVKAKPFLCPTIRARFLTQMLSEGVESWRIDLSPLTNGTTHHLSMYGMMDVALDTFPYAGTTTTCEAMWMGVPVLTMIGGCHAHNVGASFVEAVCLSEECATRTEDEYVAKGTALASDFERLAATRAGLRRRMRDGPMCDGRAFMGRVEDAYVEMFEKWCGENRADAEEEEEGRAAAAAAAGGVGGGVGGGGGANGAAATTRKAEGKDENETSSCSSQDTVRDEDPARSGGD